jgi:hypothetical protein
VSSSELLDMWDVPEPLDMLLLSEAELRDLFRTCSFPLKILGESPKRCEVFGYQM